MWVKESAAQLVGERIFPSRGEDDVIRLIMDLCCYYSPSSYSERIVDFINLLYSPKAAFKFLHSLHHLNGVAFDRSDIEHPLNTAIVYKLAEWAQSTKSNGSASRIYRLHSKSHWLDSSLALDKMVGLELGVRRKRKLEFDGGDASLRFIHAQEIKMRIDEWRPSSMHHVLWLLSNGGAYARVLSIETTICDVPAIMMIVEVSRLIEYADAF